MEVDQRVLAQFKSENGETAGPPFDLPISLDVNKLELICNAILQKEEKTPYSFFIKDKQVTNTVQATLDPKDLEASEGVLEIIYQPQAVFKVRAVTRCTSTIPGHAEAVISLSFSADGRYLASGSGDTTVRFWDINTETPHFTCKEHKHWVLCIAWAPNSRILASADKNGQICLWDPESGKQIGKTMTGHKQWVTCLAWKPLHLDPDARYVASASKDSTIRIWDTKLCQCHMTLSGHTQSVTCLRWGGTDLLYSGSQDRTVRVWRAADGILCRVLEGHGHWINTMALSTDYVMRTGAFDPAHATIVHQPLRDSGDELARKAGVRYEEAKGGEPERLVTGSDDFTLFLWQPEVDKKAVARMTGHMQLINQVVFSPDTRLIASASYDKSIRIWCGKTGRFLATLRGHVQRVYQVAWSADSRLLCSGSADSTLKVWDMTTRKLAFDLPGHADEVYALDWSPDGQRVASGGKDKVLKLWRN